MEGLKYISTERYVEGIITKVTDASVSIDLKGRMGELKVPLRMLISDYELKPGLPVGFLMSYPEVLSGEVTEEEK